MENTSYNFRRLSLDLIDVWFLDPKKVTSESLLESFLRVASTQEKDLLQKFIYEPKRSEYLATRVFLRDVLSYYTDVDPHVWQFECNNYGRPRITTPMICPELCFNLSHTKGQIIVAVALDRELGIDVEDIRRKTEVISVARSAFSKQELKSILELNEEQRVQRFYEYWTLKEAYIKARGKGLSIPTHHFSYLFCRDKIRISFDPEIVDDPFDWEFVLFSPSNTHQAALAYRKKSGDKKIQIKFLHYPESLNT